MKIRTEAGMHRVWWDLHYEPFDIENIEDNGDEGATGAVPHHTYPDVNAPWAPPGSYTVRLTANGKTSTQPLTLRLDPRVKTPALALAQVATLSRQLYDGAVAARSANTQARALSAQLQQQSGDDVNAFKARVDSLAPAPSRGGRGRFFGRGPAGPPTLESVSNALMGAAMAMQDADVAPTAGELAAAERAKAQSAEVMAKWTALKTTGLGTLNARRKAAGQAPLALPE
jgi:hypothetical protein